MVLRSQPRQGSSITGWLSGAGKGILALGGKLDEKTTKITANYHSRTIDPCPHRKVGGEGGGAESVHRHPKRLLNTTAYSQPGGGETRVAASSPEPQRIRAPWVTRQMQSQSHLLYAGPRGPVKGAEQNPALSTRGRPMTLGELASSLGPHLISKIKVGYLMLQALPSRVLMICSFSSLGWCWPPVQV